jgi:ElaB/YqjD/DUF883 family membrane-anchored ribosome-binding protein
MNTQYAQAKKDEVVDGARNMTEVAGEKIKEYAASAKEMMHDMNNTTLADVENKAGAYIRDHPGTTLLAAGALGFAVAVLFFRR